MVPPDPGYLKSNIDASLFPDIKRAGFGAVIRDDRRRFIVAKCGPLQCALDPNLAELWACKEALSWIKDTGRSKITIETDSLNVYT